VSQPQPELRPPSPDSSLVLDGAAIDRALRRIAHEIIERNPDLSRICIVGVPSRGIEVASRIASHIQAIENVSPELGVIDVSMHRDDIRIRPKLPMVVVSHLPPDLEEWTLILADDVLFSGRTVRAAMDSIASFGRPRRIQLAVLIDRGHRQESSHLPYPARVREVSKHRPGPGLRLDGQGMTAKPKAPPTTPPAASAWTRKDLISIRDLSPEEITVVLDTAAAFKQVSAREIKKVPALRGKTLINFFVEPSTRTRTSFELAAFRLSADVVNISASTSSLSKGETLKDTALNLQALHADVIVLRHSSAGAPLFLSERLASSVINAGDGAHEHPTQALLDVFTIRERLGHVAGLHVAIIGDILFSRVARSDIFALLKLGAKVTLVGPSTLVPKEFEKMGVSVTHDIDSILPEVDVVNLLRIQHERQRKEYFPSLGEYTALFGLTRERAARLKPEALIMHPGPINRGVEIDSEIADSGRSVILDQVTNGLAVRMAVLYLCAGAASLEPKA